jgi:hypothetical protein
LRSADGGYLEELQSLTRGGVERERERKGKGGGREKESEKGREREKMEDRERALFKIFFQSKSPN